MLLFCRVDSFFFFFFFSSRRRHTRCLSDWSSDVCSSDLLRPADEAAAAFDRALAGVEPAVESEAPPAKIPALPDKIGRASCRKECRSRWSPDHHKKKKKRRKN